MPEGILFCFFSGTLLVTNYQMTSFNYLIQRFEHDWERIRKFPINSKMYFDWNRFEISIFSNKSFHLVYFL